MVDDQFQAEHSQQRTADSLGRVHHRRGDADAFHDLGGELLAQLQGVNTVAGTEDANQSFTNEPGDLLHDLGQLAHYQIEAQVLVVADDDGCVQHQHPDEQIPAELLTPPDGRVQNIPGNDTDQRHDGEACGENAADHLDALFQNIKCFANGFQISLPPI